MTEKEQIIIDGCNVSGCVQFTQEGDCCNLGGSCKGWPNCYYKQLARKTQENEELKKQFETSEEWRIKAESLNENFELKNTCYRKALEKIEGMLQVIVESNKVYPLQSNLYKILDIINKAKGEECN